MYSQLYLNNNLHLLIENIFLYDNYLEYVFNYVFLFNFNYYAFKFLELLPELFFSILFIIRLFLSLSEKITIDIINWIWNLIFLLFIFIIKILYTGCCFNTIYFFFSFTWINTFYITATKILIICFFLNYLCFIKTSIKSAKHYILNETIWLLSLAVFFIFILLSSYDLFISYLTIEGLSFTLYILSSINSNNFISKEATFKYLGIGSISSAFLLVAIAWIFSVLGDLSFALFQIYLINFNEGFIIQLKLALVLVLFSFLFKLAAFPCYVWIADVYTGIWTAIAFFFSTIVKLGLALFIIRFLYTSCFILSNLWSKLLVISAVGSILIGAIGALFQTELKRFIAYASINQIGFFLLSASTKTLFGIKASLLYIFLYVIMNFLFFGIILNGFNIITGRNLIYFTDLNNLIDFAPIHSLILIITLFSMAGVPPLAGFFTKIYVFCSFMSFYYYKYHLFFILTLTIFSTFYYINIIRQIFFETSKTWTIFFINNNIFNNFFFFFWCLIVIGWLFFFNNISYFFEILALSCASPLLTSNLII